MVTWFYVSNYRRVTLLNVVSWVMKSSFPGHNWIFGDKFSVPVWLFFRKVGCFRIINSISKIYENVSCVANCSLLLLFSSSKKRIHQNKFTRTTISSSVTACGTALFSNLTRSHRSWFFSAKLNAKCHFEASLVKVKVFVRNFSSLFFSIVF